MLPHAGGHFAGSLECFVWLSRIVHFLHSLFASSTYSRCHCGYFPQQLFQNRGSLGLIVLYIGGVLCLMASRSSQ